MLRINRKRVLAIRERRGRPAVAALTVRLIVLGMAAMPLAANLPAALAEVLTEADFRQIGEPGLGDPANSYAWSMAWFKGKLYVGTNHNFLCVIKSGVAAPAASDSPEIPGDCPPRLLDADLRGRIYVYDPTTAQVELVHISPTVKVLVSDGTRVDLARDAGYRTMRVFQEKDGTEALYVGTFSSTVVPQPPARILRSIDGLHFDEVPLNVPNSGQYRSFRALTVFKNRLYVLGLTKDTATPVLLEAADPSSGAFRPVSDVGFGDPVNLAAFELAVFKGYLYVGTVSATDGFQLLKTQATGEPPYGFRPVLVKGAYRGMESQSVLSLTPFGDHLYVGTGIYFGSLTLLPDFKPAASELLRVRADDTWDIVVGEARDTPAGRKEPISKLPPGFGNPFVGYIWRMVEHEGTLYVGTLDTSVLIQYSDGLTLDNVTERINLDEYPNFVSMLEQVDLDEVADVISAFEGGFDLWSTTNGTDWKLVSHTGFGDEFSYGIRTFASTPIGLFVGSANPFLGLRLYLGQPPGTDTDGDGYADVEDNCPTLWNLAQADADGDGMGDTCDVDDDDDCLADAQEVSPLVREQAGMDTDADGQPDGCDLDDDDDGVLDRQDNCPLTPNFDQVDSDGDGSGDMCADAGLLGDDLDSGDDGESAVPIPANGENESGEDGQVASEQELDPEVGRPVWQPCGAGSLMPVAAGLIAMLAFSLHGRWRR